MLGAIEPVAREVYADATSLEVWELVADLKQTWAPDAGQTFHGRDWFAVAAARLCTTTKGVLSACCADWVKSDVVFARRIETPTASAESEQVTYGEVLAVDHFGNLITNLVAKGAVLRAARIVCSGTVFQLIPSYSAGKSEQAAAVLNSWGHVELTCKGGSAARQFGIDVGDQITITLP